MKHRFEISFFVVFALIGVQCVRKVPDAAKELPILTSDGHNCYTLGGKSNGRDAGLFIDFSIASDGMAVSSISTRDGEDRFYLSVLEADGEMRPLTYYYDHIYPTDTIIDTPGNLRPWLAENGKCHIIEYWPNSMCKSSGYFLYNESFEIDPIYMGIHRSYDERGRMTDAFDADTVPFDERIIY